MNPNFYQKGGLFLFLVLSLALNVNLFPTAQCQSTSYTFPHPPVYPCLYTTSAPDIDGRLYEESWQKASWTSNFVDISGKEKTSQTLPTRIKMMWDEDCLYLFASLIEPHIWAEMTKRDTLIFKENAFELFMDPNGDHQDYFEIQVNARGTLWDLQLSHPYKYGGKPNNAWQTPGLVYKVHTAGTLNEGSDLDTAWTVEMAIPWEAISMEAPSVSGSKRLLRMNFMRVQWNLQPSVTGYVKTDDRAEYSVWAPQGVVNIHQPQTWGYVQFLNDTIAPEIPVFSDDLFEIKMAMMAVCDQQKKFQKQHGNYSDKFSQLSINPRNTTILSNKTQLLTTKLGYQLIYSDSVFKLTVDQKGVLTLEKKP